MNNLTKATLAMTVFLGATAFSMQTVAASDTYDGAGGTKTRNGMVMRPGGQFGLIPEEMRETFREEFQNMTDEEREAMRQERAQMMEEKEEAVEEFTGMTREERRDLTAEGSSVGQVLESEGITKEDAEDFLTEQANERVETIIEKHDLNEEEVQTLQSRIAEFVQTIISRWFPTAE